MKLFWMFALATALAISPFVPAHAKVWSLENTPKQYRPKLCVDVRKEIEIDRRSTSLKWALKRKAEGTMWRQHKQRLEESARLHDAYRRLDCRNYP